MGGGGLTGGAGSRGLGTGRGRRRGAPPRVVVAGVVCGVACVLRRVQRGVVEHPSRARVHALEVELPYGEKREEE